MLGGTVRGAVAILVVHVLMAVHAIMCARGIMVVRRIMFPRVTTLARVVMAARVVYTSVCPRRGRDQGRSSAWDLPSPRRRRRRLLGPPLR